MDINVTVVLTQGQSPDTQVGRVHVYDLDDWDLPDKKFYWESKEHPNFSLDQDTGMLTMHHGTRDGTSVSPHYGRKRQFLFFFFLNVFIRCHRYHLRFHVSDRKHTQNDVPANVTVTVREITHEAVINSGSIRLAGITDEDFIRIWEYRVRGLRLPSL